jgi:hypothetical protein
MNVLKTLSIFCIGSIFLLACTKCKIANDGFASGFYLDGKKQCQAPTSIFGPKPVRLQIIDSAAELSCRARSATLYLYVKMKDTNCTFIDETNANTSFFKQSSRLELNDSFSQSYKINLALAHNITLVYRDTFARICSFKFNATFSKGNINHTVTEGFISSKY